MLEKIPQTSRWKMNGHLEGQSLGKAQSYMQQGYREG